MFVVFKAVNIFWW